jgi:ADP-heptose:LPS heptosyltransferase
MKHSLVVRLDSFGDVLICGPAVRAVAGGSDRLTMLVGPRGAEAAWLLPGVDEVLAWNCPWIASPAPEVTLRDVDDLVQRVREAAPTHAVILTSFHQSALPTALLLRLAGIGQIAAVSEDYPGTLLDHRISPPPEAPEPQRMSAIAAAAGFPLPAADDGRLAVRRPLPEVDLGVDRYVVVHPGAAVPSRTYPASSWAAAVAALSAAGRSVVVTGGPGESAMTAEIAAAAPDGRALDLGGRLDLAELAGVLARAEVVVVGNTGPAHLAAAVGTPIVSLFAPVVPAARWAPFGVPCVLLGDQDAGCRGTRATVCPLPGHPCLTSVDAAAIVDAVEQLSPALSMSEGVR